jgi:hypothetical protein
VRMKLATLQLPWTKSILAKPTCSCETQIRNCTEEGINAMSSSWILYLFNRRARKSHLLPRHWKRAMPALIKMLDAP